MAFSRTLFMDRPISVRKSALHIMNARMYRFLSRDISLRKRETCRKNRGARGRHHRTTIQSERPISAFHLFIRWICKVYQCFRGLSWIYAGIEMIWSGLNSRMH